MTVFLLLPSWDCDPHLLFLNSNESKGEKIWEERGHHWDQKKENVPWFCDFRIISWEWLRMMCCSENEESIGKDWKKEESKPLPKVSCRSCLKGPGWLNWAVYLSNAKKKKKRRRKKERREENVEERSEKPGMLSFTSKLFQGESSQHDLMESQKVELCDRRFSDPWSLFQIYSLLSFLFEWIPKSLNDKGRVERKKEVKPAQPTSLLKIGRWRSCNKNQTALKD